MNRLALLFMLCLPVWAYTEESTVSLKYIWEGEKSVFYFPDGNMPTVSANKNEPAMLASIVRIDASFPHIAISHLNRTGLSRITETSDSFSPSGAAYGDIDHDQIPEFAFMGYLPASQQHHVLLSARLKDSALETTLYPIPNGDDFRGLAVGDMDGDGKSEIVYYRVEEAAEEYWEGSLVMARVEGGELKVLGESGGHPLVGSVVIADFDGDHRQKAAVLEGRGIREHESPTMRAPYLSAYTWVDNQWAKEPEAWLALDPNIELDAAPGLAVWKDRGKSNLLMEQSRKIVVYELSNGNWSPGEALVSLEKGSIRSIGAVDLDGKGQESILAWVLFPKEKPEGPYDRFRSTIHVYQREK